MEFKLNETQQMVKDLARELAIKEIAPRQEKIDAEHTVPMELFQKIVDAGILAIPFEEKYGGLDAGYVALMLALEEFAKACPSVSVSTLVCISFLEAVRNFGSEEQKQKYIPAGIAGEFRGSLAFTEAGTGSDPKQITTTAKKEGEYYIINGVKRFITNAAYEGPLLMFARDSETNSITAFIVDKMCEGYSISSPWDTVGMKGSAIYDVFLDNVKVHESQVMGTPGKGFPILLGTVGHSKVALCATFVGTMAASYELAVKYAREKMHRDQPIFEKFSSIQMKIAKIAGMVQSARLMTLNLAEEADYREANFPRFKAWVGMTKAYVSDLAVECNLNCMNVLGAYGVCDEYHVERYLRDSLIAPHIEGVSDLQRVIAGSYIYASDDLLIQ